MKLLEKILMPVDVNKNYTEQLASAIKIAKEFNSEIWLVYVLPNTELHPDINSLLTNYIGETLENIAESFKENAIAFKKPLILNGNPTDKILQAARDEQVNLILAGSGGRSEKEEFKLGTTAEKLISLSDVPVWIAKSNQAAEITKILCPVDFSDASKRALRNAILLSNNFKASLTVLSVYEAFVNTSPRLKVDQNEINRQLAKQYQYEMKTFLKEFDLNGVKHEIQIVEGIPHEKILQTIKQMDCDLLVMGTNGRSAFSRMILGSVTEKVIRTMPCSFVTTKTQDIFKIRFDNELNEIETHFSNASRLLKSGLHKEAVNQYLTCLQINDMHIPSMYKLAEVYKTLGENEKVIYYEKMAKDLLQRLWDNKIEYEIRKHYRPGN